MKVDAKETIIDVEMTVEEACTFIANISKAINIVTYNSQILPTWFATPVYLQNHISREQNKDHDFCIPGRLRININK